MAECAYWRSSSTGVELLARAVGTSGASVENCTTLVVVTPAEYAALSSNPFNLSIEQGTQIGLAVMAVWALAAGIRAIASVFSTSHDGTEE